MTEKVTTSMVLSEMSRDPEAVPRLQKIGESLGLESQGVFEASRLDRVLAHKLLLRCQVVA